MEPLQPLSDDKLKWFMRQVVSRFKNARKNESSVARRLDDDKFVKDWFQCFKDGWEARHHPYAHYGSRDPHRRGAGTRGRWNSDEEEEEDDESDEESEVDASASADSDDGGVDDGMGPGRGQRSDSDASSDDERRSGRGSDGSVSGYLSDESDEGSSKEGSVGIRPRSTTGRAHDDDRGDGHHGEGGDGSEGAGGRAAATVRQPVDAGAKRSTSGHDKVENTVHEDGSETFTVPDDIAAVGGGECIMIGNVGLDDDDDREWDTGPRLPIKGSCALVFGNFRRTGRGGRFGSAVAARGAERVTCAQVVVEYESGMFVAGEGTVSVSDDAKDGPRPVQDS